MLAMKKLGDVFLQRSLSNIDREDRTQKNISILLHSVLGLIIGIILAYFSMNGIIERMDPKVWGVLGSSIIIVLYLPIYFIMKRNGYLTSLSEFFIYFIMGLGSWFSFYPFLASILGH